RRCAHRGRDRHCSRREALRHRAETGEERLDEWSHALPRRRRGSVQRQPSVSRHHLQERRTMTASPTLAPRVTLKGRHVLFTLVGFFAVCVAVDGFMIYSALSTFGGVDNVNAY